VGCNPTFKPYKRYVLHALLAEEDKQVRREEEAALQRRIKSRLANALWYLKAKKL